MVRALEDKLPEEIFNGIGLRSGRVASSSPGSLRLLLSCNRLLSRRIWRLKLSACKLDDSRSRHVLLKLVLPSQSHWITALTNSYRLRSSEFSKIFMRKSLTATERKQHYDLQAGITCGPDILLITKTWLSPKISDSEIIIDLPYKLFRYDRTHRKGGGVCCLPLFVSSDHNGVAFQVELIKPEVNKLPLPNINKTDFRGFSSYLDSIYWWDALCVMRLWMTYIKNSAVLYIWAWLSVFPSIQLSHRGCDTPNML
ncbi:hypothetical protein OSTOST_15949, partial [Ostertagia ostertagi]